MIDERMEEQAALHVLGALSEAESREFTQAMTANPELREFVARLSAVTAAMSISGSALGSAWPRSFASSEAASAGANGPTSAIASPSPAQPQNPHPGYFPQRQSVGG